MRWIDPATFHQVFPSSLEFEVTVGGTHYTACLRDIWGSIFGGTSFSLSEKLRAINEKIQPFRDAERARENPYEALLKNHYQSAEHRFLEDGPLFASKFWRLGSEGLFEEHSAEDLAYIWQITISRIQRQIITVFSCDRDLDPQFEFFNDVRFFPDHIYVCINKVDLVEVDKEKKIDEVTNKIKEFFEKRKIAINDTFITCGETIEGFENIETYNNQVTEMFLEITTKN